MFTQYYYKKKEDHTVCLLRCLGESSEVVVPESIDGMKVTEIGAYCFSQNSHLQGQKYEITKTGEETICMTEQAGRFITKVSLPPTIVQIGSYAFYNCRALKELTIYGSLKEIGNDTFMNCTSLHRLNIYGNYKEKTCLPFILVQISWNIEVSFLSLPETEMPETAAMEAAVPDTAASETTASETTASETAASETTAQKTAVIFYPEYMEYYEEIGPAHVFEIQVSGEGYRARKCFHDEILLLQEYDGIFPKACAEENIQILCSMAMDRMMYPAELTQENEELYCAYLKEQKTTAARMVFLDEEQELTSRLKKLRYLLEKKVLDASVLEDLLVLAAEKSMPEATATFISWKREFFSVKKKRRYEF